MFIFQRINEPIYIIYLLNSLKSDLNITIGLKQLYYPYYMLYHSNKMLLSKNYCENSNRPDNMLHLKNLYQMSAKQFSKCLHQVFSNLQQVSDIELVVSMLTLVTFQITWLSVMGPFKKIVYFAEKSNPFLKLHVHFTTIKVQFR